MEQGKRVLVSSFTDGKIADFRCDLGRKKAYRFPFSDQQTVAWTLGVPSVSTRLCFDSALMTALLARMRTSGVFRLLQKGWLRKAAIACFGKLHIGDERFAIHVEARGTRLDRKTRVECLLVAKHQSVMTGKVAAHLARYLYDEDVAAGVFHSEQLIDWKQMSGWLEREETHFEITIGEQE